MEECILNNEIMACCYYVVFQRGISIRITSVIVMLMNYLLYVIMCVITHRNFIQGSPPPTPLSTPGG